MLYISHDPSSYKYGIETTVSIASCDQQLRDQLIATPEEYDLAVYVVKSYEIAT